jgi:hypothetical protein
MVRARAVGIYHLARADKRVPILGVVALLLLGTLTAAVQDCRSADTSCSIVGEEQSGGGD